MNLHEQQRKHGMMKSILTICLLLVMGANSQSDLTCGTTVSGNVVSGGAQLYSLPAPLTATLTLDTCGSTFRTSVSVFNGKSQVNLPWGSCACGPCRVLTLGRSPFSLNIRYTVRVGGYNLQSAGSFNLRVTCQCGSRIRRDWMDLSERERNLYLAGYKRLNSQTNRKLWTFTNTHIHKNNDLIAHETYFFLPWHRYFIWEFENQLRALGGLHQCVTLPYWDWTRNSANEDLNSMFNSPLGGNGNTLRNDCVQNGLFREGNYVTSDLDCLKRKLCIGRGCYILPFETTAGLMQNMMIRKDYTSFWRHIISFHDIAHNFLGGDAATHRSPDDPFFFLIHTMVDFAWALWQDCHDYEYPANTLGPLRNHVFPSKLLDYQMPFSGPLLDAPWAQVSRTNPITPRKMHSIQDLGYKYSSTIVARSIKLGLVFTGTCDFSSASNIHQPWVAGVQQRGGLVAAEIDEQVQLWPRNMPATKQMTTAARNRMVAELACKRAKTLEAEHGGPKPCTFDPQNVEKCGESDGTPLNVTLSYLLNKTEVRNNTCLRGIRTNMYDWCKQMGCLRELCNGFYDNNCNYSANLSHDSGGSSTNKTPMIAIVTGVIFLCCAIGACLWLGRKRRQGRNDGYRLMEAHAAS